MNIEAKKISIIQQILSINNDSIIKELEEQIAQLRSNNNLINTSKTTLSKEESTLLLKINEGLPTEIQKRYNYLSTKSVQEKLTIKEHEELVSLLPKVEGKTVERLTHLIRLAQLWEMTVDEVMEKLEIQTPPTIHA